MKALILAGLLLLTLLAIVPTTDAQPVSSVDCYYIYSRTDVGNYAIIRRSTCSVPEVYECPYPHAPISECDGLIRS